MSISTKKFKLLYYKNDHDKLNQNIIVFWTNATHFREAINNWKIEFNIHEDYLLSIDKLNN
tara:strand:+ start:7560 stop:7742 length:183 start_codon:yes stop_codon:yes gene_type:complete